MKIESIDLFYLSMPEILDIGDGSQDALLVRIRAGGLEGWGECEASPLTSIAGYVCPMSHSACKPVKYALEGLELNDIKDIEKVTKKVRESSLDLLQANHTFSGIDIALWDLLGKRLEAPVHELLGYKKVYGKIPYASQLFGDTAEDTFRKGREAAQAGFKAVKFGWGPIGKGEAEEDEKHFEAARAGVGKEVRLMIDAGTVWDEDVDKAAKRLESLKNIGAYWLEEPFFSLALQSYKRLSQTFPQIPLAGGEGCNSLVQAKAMMDHSGIRFIQIDTGRIGGITTAKKIVDLAKEKGITYVNHTFTSNLALSASLQVYAGIENFNLSEYPIELKSLAKEMTEEEIKPDGDGMIQAPQKPGLGMKVNVEALKKYLVEVEIKVRGETLYYTPDF